ncbi:MAG: zinc-dependent metalloprotease [Chloroflexi bacterium]|nr:zinc-dependent metalloprotease [Chloroflexota bacterium]
MSKAALSRSFWRSAGELALVGAGIYVLERARAHHSGEAPTLDWNRARSIAMRVASPRGLHLDDTGAFVGVDEYLSYLQNAQPLVAEYTQTILPEPLKQVYVFDRRQWLEANIANFMILFAPVEQAYREASQKLTARSLTPFVSLGGSFLLSTQLGLLLGYLARRVLGQYDLALLGREPLTAGRLYFVEENIAATEHALHLPGDQFRLWIALHEATHAFEFEAHPWLASYLNQRVEEHMQLIVQQLEHLPLFPDVDGVVRVLQRAAQRLAGGGHWVELFLDDRQQALFRQLQGLMSLMEGYSNHVMDVIGVKLLPDYVMIKQRFEQRRIRQTRLDKLWARLTGLDIKLEQYVIGQAFVDQVVREKGIAFLNQAFAGPEYLPDLVEIHQPERWIARMVRTSPS